MTLLLPVFGNNWAYVVSTVAANMLERRVIVTENNGNKKRCDTDFVVITTA